MQHRILIIDNQNGVSHLLQSVMATLSKDLVYSEARSGEEAILEARKNKIDLLITEFRLPGITGVELMKKYRAINPAGKVIIISGIIDQAGLKQISASTPDAYFSKPVPLADFLGKVEILLGLTPSKTGSEEPEKKVGLSDLLVSVGRKMNAQAAILVDGLGQVVAEAGRLPDSFDKPALVSALLGLHSAAQKAAGVLGRAQEQLHLFCGSNVEGIFLLVGNLHFLFLSGSGLSKTLQLPGQLESLFATSLELQGFLEKTKSLPEIRPDKAAIEAAPAGPQASDADEIPADFIKIFEHKALNADSFWEKEIDTSVNSIDPDKLSYEQAVRLGLAPNSAQDN